MVFITALLLLKEKTVKKKKQIPTGVGEVLLNRQNMEDAFVW